MKKIANLLLGAILIISCNKKQEEKSLDVPTLDNSVSTLEATSTPNMPTTYSVPEAQTAPAGVKLNPPHGEPGHICEIAVGAPLPETGNNTAVGAIAPVVETNVNRPLPISPSPTSILNAPINTTVPSGPKPKFNPPHGEPWHDCDLDVGAPLN